MKRILHIIDTSGPGGAETVFMDLFTGFSGGSYESHALVTPESWVEGALRGIGVVPHTCDPKGSLNLRYLGAILRVIRQEHIDLIQTHLSGPSIYGSLAGLLTGTPVVSVFHGTVDLKGSGLATRVKTTLVNRGSDRIVAVSHHLRDHLAANTALDPKKMEVIYNGVDLSRFHGHHSPALRHELGLRADAFIVGSLGNIREPKGYPYLLEAAAQLRESHPHVHFVIAGHGRGQLMEELNQMVSDLSLKETVLFLGFRDDAVGFLSGCDAFLLPSTTEGFSIATIEAMACGLPVVVTRSGGPEEIVTHDVDGWMVPAGDARAIAGGIRTLAQDLATRRRLGSRGKNTVTARFSLPVMIAEYERRYEEVWQRRGGR